ncbi:hypothetical protein [bacterium endosymbiont of Pedicinus badii]|uniref:hypothetical protein n=1 Tax=bacterium endosymbiont of Pedicinus badii TaxID=1719126 RepID=UPI0018A8313C|nr:hypothetical protein [bacterium endosymbiont of Pedicinus badii]
MFKLNEEKNSFSIDFFIFLNMISYFKKIGTLKSFLLYKFNILELLMNLKFE